MILNVESLFSLSRMPSRAECSLLYQTPWFVLQDEWNTRVKDYCKKIFTHLECEYLLRKIYPGFPLKFQVSRSFSSSFREYFSPFLHSTCSLSVPNLVFSLWSAISPYFKIQLQRSLLFSQLRLIIF